MCPLRPILNLAWNNIINGVFVITVILNLFGFAYAAIIPVWAVQNFEADPISVGLLASAEGGGAFLGSITLAFWARPPHFQRLFLIGAVVFVSGLLIASKLSLYGVALLVLFGGGGKLSRLMGDFGKGIKSFKQGMNEEETKPAKQISHDAKPADEGLTEDQVKKPSESK